MIRIERIGAEALAASRAHAPRELARRRIVVPSRLDEIPRPPELLDSSARGELAKSLEENLSRLSPHVAVLDAARSLAEPRACAVVTGQQPGFLVSPLYCLYKALHALRLRSNVQAGNFRGARDQWRALQRNLWFYGILSATKP